jgi:hypothetical protein
MVKSKRETLEDCQRYYEIGYNEKMKNSDNSQQCYLLTDNVPFKVTKRRTPIMCMKNETYYGTNIPESCGIVHKDTRKFVSTAHTNSLSVFSQYSSGLSYDWTADAELPICMNNVAYISSTSST